MLRGVTWQDSRKKQGGEGWVRGLGGLILGPGREWSLLRKTDFDLKTTLVNLSRQNMAMSS